MPADCKMTVSQLFDENKKATDRPGHRRSVLIAEPHKRKSTDVIWSQTQVIVCKIFTSDVAMDYLDAASCNNSHRGRSSTPSSHL